MKKKKEHPIMWEQIGNFFLSLFIIWCIGTGIAGIIIIINLHFSPLPPRPTCIRATSFEDNNDQIRPITDIRPIYICDKELQ